MPNRSGNVVIDVEVEVTFEDGASFSAMIRSKFFLEKHIFIAQLPASTKEIDFEDYEVEDRLFTALGSVISFISNICNVFIIVLIKRGEVQDQDVNKPNNDLPRNVGRAMVQSDTFNQHIT